MPRVDVTSSSQNQKIPSDSTSPCRKTPEYTNSEDLEIFYKFDFLLLGPPSEKIEFFSLDNAHNRFPA